MQQIARIIGGAGTGKTTELMKLLSRVLEEGVSVDQIGFATFTRAARREASTRAAAATGLTVETLEKELWFRTVHSICIKQTAGAWDKLLTGNASSRKWLAENISPDLDFDGDEENIFGCAAVCVAHSPAAKALSLWAAARARLTSLAAEHERQSRFYFDAPSWADTLSIVSNYERCKRLDGCADYADVPGIYAGWKFTLDGPVAVEPIGAVPDCFVWFFDEQQDTGALLDSVCRRLITPARWIYVVGDPFQSIYNFAGSDSRLFRSWPVERERILPKSYRCPAPILEFGESFLRSASDYYDRHILPADHAGSVTECRNLNDALHDVSPRESWLLLARTHAQVGRITSYLRRAGIPWVPTKGHGGWDRPKRNAALLTLLRLEKREDITVDDWRAAIDSVPVKFSGRRLLEHGLKANPPTEPGEGLIDLAGLHTWGATADFCEMLANGSWADAVDSAQAFRTAAGVWGAECVASSRVRVGTVHSAKGLEADNVAWLTAGSRTIAAATSSDADEYDTEQRVSYVAATRARRRLLVINDRGCFGDRRG